MHSWTFYTAALTAILGLTSTVNAQINKPYHLDNGEIVQILDPLTTYVPATPATIVQWPQDNHFPNSCVSEAQVGNKCPIANIKVYNVTYSDCPRPWVMCRCDDATVSLQRMVTMFGKVPVKSRVFVRHLFAWPDNTPGLAAYAYGGDIGLVGGLFTSTGADEMFVLMHEVGHILDSQLGITSGTQFSQEINKDTCVPRPYSQTSPAEDLGDLNAFIYLMKVNRSAYDASNAQWDFSCMNNQLNYVEQVFGQYNILGGTCPARTQADSPTIYVPTVTLRGRTVHIAPESVEDTTGWVRYEDGAGFYGTKQ